MTGLMPQLKLRLGGWSYVDTNKYEDEALLKRLAEVDCVVVRSATKMRDQQIDLAQPQSEADHPRRRRR